MHIVLEYPVIENNCETNGDHPTKVTINLPNERSSIEPYYSQLYKEIIRGQEYLWQIQQSDASIQHRKATLNIFNQFSDFCLRESHQTDWFEKFFYTICETPALDTMISELQSKEL